VSIAEAHGRDPRVREATTEPLDSVGAPDKALELHSEGIDRKETHGAILLQELFVFPVFHALLVEHVAEDEVRLGVREVLGALDPEPLHGD